MNSLKNKEYVILENFLNSEEVEYQSNSLKSLKINQFWHDPQSPNAFSIHNYLPQIEVLCNKLHIIANAVGEPLFPTYTYCRKYLQGNELPKHIDRKNSEIAVSVHLYGDQKWPLFFELKDGSVVSLELKAGDAVLYKGSENYHWREPYTGNEFGQFFLFYVKSRGPLAENYFDNEILCKRKATEKQRQELLKGRKKFQ